MKSFILFAVIIISSTTLLVIVDHSVFNRHNDNVHGVQHEYTEINGKTPSGAVGEMDFGANANPVAKSTTLVDDYRSNKIETDRQTGNALIVVKTDTETTSATGNESAIETKSIDKTKPAPAAVPVVTPEEAEKSNRFALFISRIKGENKITVVEGTIEERSELPNPAKSDYPDCRFTAHFIGNAIKSGSACPKDISLVLEGFVNYTTQETDSLKNGDKVICTITPFELLPEDEQSTQQVDDLDLFLLDNYYVFDIEKINDFSDNGLNLSSGIFFSGKNTDYISIFERKINFPISDDLKEAQAKVIQNDLRKMNDLLGSIDDSTTNDINKQFAEVWEKEKAKDPQNFNRVKVEDETYVWRNIDNSFWGLPERYSFMPRPDLLTQRTLDCFLSLKRACEKNGVQLMVSFVPDCHVISSRVINKKMREIPDIQTATYVKQLSAIGVETIYASDSIIRNYNRYPFAFFYPENGHPSDTTQDVISDILAERLSRYHLPKSLSSSLFSENQPDNKNYRSQRHLFPPNCDMSNNKRPWPTREILYNGNVLSKDISSQVMLVGNSFMQFPAKDEASCSLPSLVSLKTLSPIDWHTLYATGPLVDFPNRLLSNPDLFLAQKKILIIYVGTRHLMQVNQDDSMSNIETIDKYLLLLNNKQCIMTSSTFSSSQSVEALDAFPKLSSSFTHLSTQNYFVIGDSKNIVIDIISLEQIPLLDPSKPMYLAIPSCCNRNMTCHLIVNGQRKQIQSFYETAQFNILAFELPAGTGTISVSAEGKPGTLFVIKDIQIWQ